MHIFKPTNHSNPHITYQPLAADSKARHDAAEVARKFYGFKHVLEVVSSVEKIGSEDNLIVRGITRAKKEGEIFIKRFRDGTDFSRSHTIMAAFEHCIKEGVRVPEPFRRERKFGGSIYAAFKVVDGNHYSGTEKELRAVARESAKLAKALAAFKGAKKVQEQKPLTGFLVPQEHVEWLRSLKEPKNEAEALLFAEKAFILEELEKSASLMAAVGVMHGRGITVQALKRNPHPHDFIFEHGKSRPVTYDLEWLCHTELSRYLAYLVHRFPREAAIRNGRLEGDIPRLTGEFLDAYNSISSVGIRDTQHIPVIMAAEYVDLVFIIIASYRKDPNNTTISGVATWKEALEKHLMYLHEAQHYEFLEGGSFSF